MNKHWPRWIFSSICDHFSTQSDIELYQDHSRGDAKYPLLIEGQNFDTNRVKHFLELRVDGPVIAEISKDWFHIGLEINILVQSTMTDTDFHNIHEMVGVVAASFTAINLYKYGNGDDDDDSYFGCLKLLQMPKATRGDNLQIRHFGQIDPRLKIQQASVEGHYKAHLGE